MTKKKDSSSSETSYGLFGLRSCAVGINCHVPWNIAISSWFNGQRGKPEAHHAHELPRTLSVCAFPQIKVDQYSTAPSVDHNVGGADIAMKGPRGVHVFEGCKRGKHLERV